MCHKDSLPFVLSILFFNPFVYSHVSNITRLEDFNTLINNNNAAVVKFFAPWCSFCTATDLPFEELSNQYTEKQIPFAQVNIDELPALSKRYEIKYMPTFILYHRGEPAKKSCSLTVIERTLKRLDSDDTLGPVEENSMQVFDSIIEFILIPLYFISKIFSKIISSIMQLFS